MSAMVVFGKVLRREKVRVESILHVLFDKIYLCGIPTKLPEISRNLSKEI